MHKNLVSYSHERHHATFRVNAHDELGEQTLHWFVIAITSYRLIRRRVR